MRGAVSPTNLLACFLKIINLKKDNKKTQQILNQI